MIYIFYVNQWLICWIIVSSRYEYCKCKSHGTHSFSLIEIIGNCLWQSDFVCVFLEVRSQFHGTYFHINGHRIEIYTIQKNEQNGNLFHVCIALREMSCTEFHVKIDELWKCTKLLSILFWNYRVVKIFSFLVCEKRGRGQVTLPFSFHTGLAREPETVKKHCDLLPKVAIKRWFLMLSVSLHYAKEHVSSLIVGWGCYMKEGQ